MIFDSLINFNLIKFVLNNIEYFTKHNNKMNYFSISRNPLYELIEYFDYLLQDLHYLEEDYQCSYYMFNEDYNSLNFQTYFLQKFLQAIHFLHDQKLTFLNSCPSPPTNALKFFHSYLIPDN